MGLVVFGSLKASPGVTTAVLATAAAARHRAGILVADCDSAGGDIAGRLDCSVDPGLVSLAAATRDGHGDALVVNQHTQTLITGVQVLTAPTGLGQATVALTALARVRPHPVTAAGLQAGRLVLADVGRINADTAAWPVISGADQAVLVLRPRFEEITHAAARLPEIISRAPRWGLLIVGRGPYAPEEIARSLGIPVVGVLPHDRTGATVVGQAVTGRWAAVRTRLPREAQRVVANLAVPLPAQDAQPPRTRRQRRARIRAIAERKVR